MTQNHFSTAMVINFSCNENYFSTTTHAKTFTYIMIYVFTEIMKSLKKKKSFEII